MGGLEQRLICLGITAQQTYLSFASLESLCEVLRNTRPLHLGNYIQGPTVKAAKATASLFGEYLQHVQKYISSNIGLPTAK